MRRRVTIPMAVVALMCMALAPVARADHVSAEEIAKRCVVTANRLADRCVASNAATTQRALAAIRKLLEEGKEDAAIRTARRAAGIITSQSDLCVRQIRQMCDRCIEVLLRLDHPELARRVHAACGDAVERVRHSQRRALSALRNALPSGEVSER